MKKAKKWSEIAKATDLVKSTMIMLVKDGQEKGSDYIVAIDMLGEFYTTAQLNVCFYLGIIKKVKVDGVESYEAIDENVFNEIMDIAMGDRI